VLPELQLVLNKTFAFITPDRDEALKLADPLVILKGGAVVQQGDPQHILRHPADPYIEDFVSDINRARVLRVRSITSPLSDGPFDGDIDAGSTLEHLIALCGGDTTKIYRVTEDGAPIGQLDIKDLVKALVPSIRRNPSEKT